MSASEKIPKAMADKFAAITTLTDAFCAKYLDEAYRQIIHRVVTFQSSRKLKALVECYGV